MGIFTLSKDKKTTTTTTATTKTAVVASASVSNKVKQNKNATKSSSITKDSHGITQKTIVPESSSSSSDATVCRQRIIACMDGTWDVASAHTNVFRFFNSLETSYPLQSENSNETWSQVSHYVEGVGTRSDGIQKYLGGAYGLGISDQILTAYAFLSENYKGEQDEIWLFGASRGGYSARSLAGMIYNVGLLPCQYITVALDEAYNLYRRADRKSHPSDPEAVEFRRKYNCFEPEIRFLGCMDTVGSLGVPRLPWYLGGSLLWSLFHGLHSFHDTKLSPKVKSAFHALAIHEQREWFHPALMKYGSHKRPEQTLKQLWFPGTHSDVIGGPRASRVLCNHSLQWIMMKAQECGLVFKSPIDEICGARAFLYNDSYRNQIVYRLLPRKDRYIDPTLFPDQRALYMDGHFSEYITVDQLRLFRSKTLDKFLSTIKKTQEQQDREQSTSSSTSNKK
ncbi:hypothetical protein BDA99DRAFT_502338 [Phascolomyces articulosus]|uniref:T6SS Phospholipase effector Tle1-like catalytic domain-containing protein n=1 Tax=Phascolomyces articulosus TaxID=60185 RepID=A0AAD5KFW3_9FUNG|nr:hypothetical protein BDA99DRAFT_502338 [Phascolomyces articulosus]